MRGWVGGGGANDFDNRLKGAEDLDTRRKWGLLMVYLLFLRNPWTSSEPVDETEYTCLLAGELTNLSMRRKGKSSVTE